MTETNKQTLAHALEDYEDQLFAFIRSRVNSREDAEDIAQEVWFQLSRVINMQPIEQVGAWLYRVARNRIIDSYRKLKNNRLENWMDMANEEDEGIPGIYEQAFATSGSGTLRETFWEALMEALDELPEAQKDAFVMNELENMTFEEIAAKTGENIKTLISRKRYAVAYLRERMAFWYEEIINN